MWWREKFIQFGIKLRKLANRIHKWGTHRLSLMVVPHNHKHILKISLSNYLIVFISFLTVIALSLWIFPFFDEERVKDTSAEKLANETEEQRALLKVLLWQVAQMGNQARVLSEVTGELHQYVWPDFYSERLEEFIEDADDFVDSVSNFESVTALYSDLKGFHERLQKLKEFYDNGVGLLAQRWEIFELMPKGNPLPEGVGQPTSSFGWRVSPFGFAGKKGFHTGQDLATSEGTPIYAAADGIVETAQPYPSGGLGIHVKIEHQYGIRSVYAHCRRIVVRKGQTVKKRQLIGYVGQTGSATGPHLHYEVQIGKDYQNPNIYLSPFGE